MLPHKKDQLFTSVPVSRVGLTTRLNQLNVPSQSRATSRPSTPGFYVTSSLNPTKNIPVTSNSIRSRITTQDELEDFENLPIASNLRKFESTFTELSQSISSFKEGEIAAQVGSLIHISDDISEDIHVLQEHQELGKEIDHLQKNHTELENETTHLLKELISFRADLKKLPRLPAARDAAEQDPNKQLNAVSIKELLDYAQKLAKFSKAPATVNSQLIHPNNYIWPAEDALRRGMLAMASLKPDELVKAEIGETEHDDDEDVEMEDVDDNKVDREPSPAKEEVPVELAEESREEKKASPQKVHHTPKQEAKPAPQPVNTLDLDLFDPDEDDSD